LLIGFYYFRLGAVKSNLYKLDLWCSVTTQSTTECKADWSEVDLSFQTREEVRCDRITAFIQV
jgi:hypothetical protein